MEAKLYKVENTFYLKVGETILGTSSNPNLSASIRYSLSLKNCQAIERGYDVYELAKENYHKFWSIIDESGLINHTFGYVEGFQKALELMGDKKFSEDDMKEAMLNALEMTAYQIEQFRKDNKYHIATDIIQSLQQTEWDVEIVMEKVKDETKIVGSVKGVKGSGNKITTYKSIPKLDADDCIILKLK